MTTAVLEQRRQTAFAAYHQLVVKHAKGEGADINPDDMRSVLFDAGRTFAQLEADVAKVACRLQAAQQIEQAAQQGPAIAQLRLEQHALQFELRAAIDNANRVQAQLQADVDAKRAAHAAKSNELSQLKVEVTQLRDSAIEALKVTAAPFPQQAELDELESHRRSLNAVGSKCDEAAKSAGDEVSLRAEFEQLKTRQATIQDPIGSIQHRLGIVANKLKVIDENMARARKAWTESEALQPRIAVLRAERDKWHLKPMHFAL